MMKKSAAILLSATIVSSLAACGRAGAESEDETAVAGFLQESGF